MKSFAFIIALLIVSPDALPQESVEKKEAPAYKLFRANEDYFYLLNKENSPYEEDLFDALKYIPINDDRNRYLTFGGELRPRVEYFENRDWEEGGDELFYSQRISLHSNLTLGNNLRMFAELYHGYTSHEKEFAQYDELDLHQGFVELAIPMQNSNQLSLQFGRQEKAFGAARLVGLREGPNIRRTFDELRATFSANKNTYQAFYGREVRPEFYVFDNDFVLFDHDAGNPALWGMYSQFNIHGDIGRTELYYLGFQSDMSQFNDVVGEEARHTIGVRRFGTIGERWIYNTELIYQFGELSGQDIQAYSIETDWHYQYIQTRWSLSIGLKLELTSGDSKAGDGEINSFNPTFVNPAYYSLAGTIAPVNIKSIHPSLTLHPTEKLVLYGEWAVFWRESTNDGLYRPPRFLTRDSTGTQEKNIGNQLGVKIGYEFGRHLSFDLDMSYFIAGAFLEATGESENILHIAPTLSYKF